MTDAGFWLALHDRRDQHYEAARDLPVDLDTLPIIVPWPCLYETLSTRTVRDQRRLAVLLPSLRRSNVHFLPDEPYRGTAVETISRFDSRKYRALSLADHIIRLALADPNVQVSGLVTFNPNDFRDVCARRGIALLP
jgi:predicted nucleic acid-binding protein